MVKTAVRLRWETIREIEEIHQRQRPFGKAGEGCCEKVLQLLNKLDMVLP